MEKLANTTDYRPLGVDDEPLLLRGYAALSAWFQRRRTQHALMACSDRVLADIGIVREDIPLVARGGEPLTVAPGSGWLATLRSSLQQIIATDRARRRERAELMAYSDKELDDVGIRRADIPAVLNRTLNPRHA